MHARKRGLSQVISSIAHLLTGQRGNDMAAADLVAMLDAVDRPLGSDRRLWGVALPYLRRHIADHAQQADRLDVILEMLSAYLNPADELTKLRACLEEAHESASPRQRRAADRTLDQDLS